MYCPDFASAPAFPALFDDAQTSKRKYEEAEAEAAAPQRSFKRRRLEFDHPVPTAALDDDAWWFPQQ